MGLEQDLAAYRAEFARKAPAERAALFEAKINELRASFALENAIGPDVLMSGVAIVAFNRAVHLLGPIAATAVIALIPAVASMLAIPFLGEVPTPAGAVALAIIVVGVLLAGPARMRAPVSSPAM